MLEPFVGFKVVRRIDSRIDQVKAQVQDEQLEENICLKLAIYIVIMDM
jgi:hypothetical protein